MKTSVDMIRKMGGFNITQRTKDGMFNATELLKQWNKSKNQKKNVNHFLDNKETKQFTLALINDLDTQNYEKPNDQVLIDTKSKTSKNGKKIAGSKWMHPYLFIKFAMWINPEFELDVIKFVYDQLIEYRHSAGDMYKGLTNALSKFHDVNFPQVAMGLNWIIFNKHEKGIRETATQEQLKELTDLEKNLAFAIDMGLIKSYDGFISEMRKIYNLKNSKF